jgi:hypothetical protein
VQESWKTELQIERYDSRSMGSKMVFSEGSRGICGIFEWQEALAQKNKGVSVKFWSVWSC